jgi:hypothetical protein
MNREPHSLCYIQNSWLDSVRLHYRFDFRKDPEFSVPTSNDGRENVVDKRKHDSLCFCAMHMPYTVRLYHRFHSWKELALRVAMLNDDGKYVLNEWRTLLTVLLCNALARYCVPSLSI